MSVPKGLNAVKSADFSGNGVIIEPDVIIGKSLGAAARSDVVLLPNGNKGRIKEGTKITKVVKFAGQGTNNPVKISKKLSKIYKDYDVIVKLVSRGTNNLLTLYFCPRHGLKTQKRLKYLSAKRESDKKRPFRRIVFFGSPCWARTSDIMINSHALYRLS